MKRNKYVLRLTNDQIHLCIKAMLEFRSYALERDIDTVDIDKLIKLLSK